MQDDRTPFSSRQTSDNPYFEFFHSVNEMPPRIEYHTHDFYEILFFVSGEAEYAVEGRTYTLRPGDIMLTCPNELHCALVHPGKTYDRYMLWVQPGYLRMTEQLGTRLTPCFEDSAQKQYKLMRPTPAVRHRLLRLCQKLGQAYVSEEYGHDALKHVYMLEFLVNLNRAYFDTSAEIASDITENAKVNEIIRYINSHLQEELSLDGLAKHFFISKFYLSNQFKSYTGMTVYRYIMKKRLLTARQLISEGTAVTDACYRSGFGDYSNFLKAFKAEYRQNPKAFAPQN